MHSFSNTMRLSGPVTLFSALLLACGGADDSSSSSGSPGGTQPGSGGGSVVLSASDVYTVSSGLVEEGIPISGNLRPIESVTIRARLEGNIVALHVREGDQVREGGLMAEFESAEQEALLRSAQADVIAAKGDSETAQWNLEQTRELFQAGAVAEREYRAAEQSAVSAAARLAAAESRERAAIMIERDTRVVAPLSGVVERRMVENGERVSRGVELFTLVRNEVLELTAAVPARRASGLVAGQTVRFAVDGRTIEGRVTRISPTIDLQSQSVTVYVRIPNAGGLIKGNAFATGQIIERALDGEMLIPQSAIRQMASTAGGGTFVWRIEQGELVNTPVRVGIVDEARGLVQVLEGISPGQEIVVGNVGMLGEGMQVQIIGTESQGVR